MDIKLNNHFLDVKETYLFSDIAKRVRKFQEENPDREIIRMGIGDVTLPLPGSVTSAMEEAVKEMASKDTFKGYPPEYGYEFLRNAISDHYKELGVNVAPETVYVSDGAKSDLGNLPDVLGDNPVIIPDPVYPVYVDSNLMNGRQVSFVEGNKENDFLPLPPADTDIEPSVIYICSPNNPTGAVYGYEGLKAWVDFALNTGSLIIFDAAYEAFISEDKPHTIYEIPGADLCAVEVSSFSKFAGFTGVRCGWTVVPDSLESDGIRLSKFWARRQATKFNGVSYVTQKGAAASLSGKGLEDCKANIAYYKRNAAALAEVFTAKGIYFTGGVNSPYIWLKCPDDMGGWEFFDMILNRFGIVGTPGEGFGENGAGYFRLTAFGSYENTLMACEFFKTL
ncbi:MAG: LL-diaminopimelate aminotransferase [Clostridiales bacterium]|nr:LL-diaminopimelate aminotransferase [Clostridiales bacterium]